MYFVKRLHKQDCKSGNFVFDVKWISKKDKSARFAADWISKRYEETLENEPGIPCPMHISMTCHCKGCCESPKFTIQEIGTDRVSSILGEKYAAATKEDLYYPLGLIFSARPDEDCSKETIEFWHKTRQYAFSLELHVY